MKTAGLVHTDELGGSEERKEGMMCRAGSREKAAAHWILTTIPGFHKEAGFIYGTLIINFLRTILILPSKCP